MEFKVGDIVITKDWLKKVRSDQLYILNRILTVKEVYPNSLYFGVENDGWTKRGFTKIKPSKLLKILLEIK
jgi:hypothetical protein